MSKENTEKQYSLFSGTLLQKEGMVNMLYVIIVVAVLLALAFLVGIYFMMLNHSKISKELVEGKENTIEMSLTPEGKVHSDMEDKTYDLRSFSVLFPLDVALKKVEPSLQDYYQNLLDYSSSLEGVKREDTPYDIRFEKEGSCFAHLYIRKNVPVLKTNVGKYRVLENGMTKSVIIPLQDQEALEEAKKSLTCVTNYIEKTTNIKEMSSNLAR